MQSQNELKDWFLTILADVLSVGKKAMMEWAIRFH